MDIITKHLREIIPPLFLLVMWLLDRKKRKQELTATQHKLKAAETSNQQQIVDLYQEALSDLKVRYDEKFAELAHEIKELRTNLELWKTKYRS